jgi:hypothetical protein
MTWAHARGHDPMVATARAYMEAHPGVTITGRSARSRPSPTGPIGEMAGTYDLMVIDHPHVGEVPVRGNLLPTRRPARRGDGRAGRRFGGGLARLLRVRRPAMGARHRRSDAVAARAPGLLDRFRGLGEVLDLAARVGRAFRLCVWLMCSSSLPGILVILGGGSEVFLRASTHPPTPSSINFHISYHYIPLIF